jgi:hypothetical protein
MSMNDYTSNIRDLFSSGLGAQVLESWKKAYVNVEIGAQSLTDKDIYAKIGIHNFIVMIDKITNGEIKK